jgi:uncharacterized protein with ParB-like and HNH nuclease domain
MPVSIHATELPLFKIFSNDFAFSIPPYQRPYSWTTEQASDLYSDISFACNGQEDIKDTNPYFLGSIVLIKGDSPDADVVDGQQRLTTITIFLSVLRKFVPTDFAKGLTKFLYEEGDVIVNSPNRYRVKLRSRDEEFFHRYIQDEKGIDNLLALNGSSLTDSQKNMQENAKYFYEKLPAVSPEQRVRLLQYMMTRCYLVVVSTPDIDAAYRIFTVMNARGLDLKLPDLLKAEIIGAIENDQEKYTKIWETEEEELGRDAFQELFAHIRMIYQRAKLRVSAIKEFRESIKPQEFPAKFIDEVLKPYSDAFEIIKKASYQSDKDANKINVMFRWLNQIDNFDWVPPAIVYLSAHSQNPSELLKFLTDLERLAAGLMIKRADINERIERYALLLSAIDNKVDLYVPDSPLQLTPEEQKQIVEVLNGDLYLIARIRQYVLLRLDTALSAGGASYYDLSIISVEHVLPQNPSEGSIWLQWFPISIERENYVHRIGNLVLLSRRKNAQAQNYDFVTKKEKYFKTSDGISPFALTTQVLKYDSWTPAIIDERQKEQIQKLKSIWNLYEVF